MRSFLIILGAMFLFITPAVAFNDSTVKYCATTPQPKHCLISFLEYEPYAQEYVQFLYRIENDPNAIYVAPGDRVKAFCSSNQKADTCLSIFSEFTPYAIGFLQWHDRLNSERTPVNPTVRDRQEEQRQQEQFAQQRELQQRQIDAQLEQARIQANGMAMFGAGNALVNGMNQGLQNMQQPYVNTPHFTYPPAKK